MSPSTGVMLITLVMSWYCNPLTHPSCQGRLVPRQRGWAGQGDETTRASEGTGQDKVLMTKGLAAAGTRQAEDKEAGDSKDGAGQGAEENEADGSMDNARCLEQGGWWQLGGNKVLRTKGLLAAGMQQGAEDKGAGSSWEAARC